MRKPSLDTLIRKFLVLTDRREQNPFIYANQTKYCTLKAGDYSLEYEGRSYADTILIERKGSPSELFSATGTNRDRFERELELLSKVEIKFVVCEFNFMECVKNPPPGLLPASAVYGSFCSWHARFNVPFIFCGNRANARNYVYKVFYSYVSHRIIGQTSNLEE